MEAWCILTNFLFNARGVFLGQQRQFPSFIVYLFIFWVIRKGKTELGKEKKSRCVEALLWLHDLKAWAWTKAPIYEVCWTSWIRTWRCVGHLSSFLSIATAPWSWLFEIIKEAYSGISFLWSTSLRALKLPHNFDAEGFILWITQLQLKLSTMDWDPLS